MYMCAAITRAETIKELWLELLVSRQCGASHAERVIPDVVSVPGWFRARELGLALGEGPDVFWTMRNLPRINRANREAFEAQERGEPAPKAKKPAKRRSAQELQHAYRRKLARLANELG